VTHRIAILLRRGGCATSPHVPRVAHTRATTILTRKQWNRNGRPSGRWWDRANEAPPEPGIGASHNRETAAGLTYSIRSPLIARAITRCWICSVPSKMS
jgi:hypothetical protein